MKRSSLEFPSQLGPSLFCPTAPSAGSSQTDLLLCDCAEVGWSHMSHLLYWMSCTVRGHSEQRLSMVTHWKCQPFKRSGFFRFRKFSCMPCFQLCTRNTFRRILSCRGYERKDICPLSCNALHRALQSA